MNCLNGNFDLTFPLTPSLSLGERANHFAPWVDISRLASVQPSWPMLPTLSRWRISLRPSNLLYLSIHILKFRARKQRPQHVAEGLLQIVGGRAARAQIRRAQLLLLRRRRTAEGHPVQPVNGR